LLRDFRAAFRGDFIIRRIFATPRPILASDQAHETEQEKSDAPTDVAGRAFALFSHRRSARTQTSQ
jgi:hypothetical protein